MLVLDRAGVAIVATVFALPVSGACNAKPDIDPTGYREAIGQVRMLQTFKTWQAEVAAKPGRKIAFGFSVDKQQVMKDRCYWSVTIYSDEGSHLSRWKTFLVPTQTGDILAENGNGDFVPLAPRRDQPVTTDKSCSDEIGEQKAARLVKQCLEVSPATHPPCNAWNPCELIEREIRRNCKNSTAPQCEGYS